MTQEEKDKAVQLLVDNYLKQWEQLMKIDPRLCDYINFMRLYPHLHNAYEILGAVKFLRLLRTYELDIPTFRDVVFKYEGVWEQRDGIWHHVDGGLKHPGSSGPRYYRLQPFQVFVLASMFLFNVWIDTEEQAGSRELLPTEKVMETEE